MSCSSKAAEFAKKYESWKQLMKGFSAQIKMYLLFFSFPCCHFFYYQSDTGMFKGPKKLNRLGQNANRVIAIGRRRDDENEKREPERSHTKHSVFCFLKRLTPLPPLTSTATGRKQADAPRLFPPRTQWRMCRRGGERITGDTD